MPQEDPSSESKAVRGRFFLKIIVSNLIAAAVLFASAGTVRWPAGWLYLLCVCLLQLHTTSILLKNPDLLAERSRMQPGTRTWDLWIAPLAAVAGPVLCLVTAGLERRLQGDEPWNLAQAAGLMFLVAGALIGASALAANPFFSSTVRIQSDRGHRVCDSGPYRRIRHPGYFGWLLSLPGAPLTLQSTWAWWVAAGIGILVLLRTALEDRALQSELDGYQEYASRVRWRLLPGLW